jgi:imidazole glycerol phosphate synthase subunit HisF
MKNLLKALAKFNTLCGPIVKDASNPFFKSKYATLDAIQEHIRKPLAEAGLVVTQPTRWVEGQAIVVSTVYHVETGESLYSEFPVVVGKHTAQDYGSAVTYAKRYSLTGLLNLIVCDEDDDGNKASANVTQTKNVSEGNELPWLNESSTEWPKVVASLKNGYTIADVRKKFKVSKAIESKLMSSN